MVASSLARSDIRHLCFPALLLLHNDTSWQLIDYYYAELVEELGNIVGTIFLISTIFSKKECSSLV